MLDRDSKTKVIDEFVDQLMKERNRKSYSSEIKQDLYIQILNKLSNLFFSIERVENDDRYQSDAYYEDVLLDIREIEDLEKEYQTEWINALKKSVEIYLNAALANIDNSNLKQKDFSFNQAIYALTFCKNKNVLKEKYYKKLEQ